jgi:urease accessory protein
MRTLDKRIDPQVKLAAALVKRAATVTLAFDERCKSRLAATLDSGEEVALLLPRGTVLRDGDILVAQDGGLVRIVAAAETVLYVRAADTLTLTRAAYHLGNRHTPVEVGADYLKLEYDAVLADMLVRLGASVEQTSLPFQPESGAYGGGHRHGHDATFAEDYALAQKVYDEHHGHAPGHGDSHEDGHGHSHGDDHGHGHGDSHEAHGHSHGDDQRHEHAHGDSHDHAHGHAHGNDHRHEHGHDSDHEHERDHEHGHDHDQGHGPCDPSCGHDHAHR